MNKFIISPLVRQAVTVGLNKPLGSLRVAAPLAAFTFEQRQVRYAGHSKWQNIRATKTANDAVKGQNAQRYAYMIRRAILDANGQGDLKLNTRLADVYAAALKVGVMKATLDRAIKRTVEAKTVNDVVEVMGPGGCFVLVEFESDEPARVKHEVKLVIRKFKPSGIMKAGQAKHAFAERGYIKIAKNDADGKEISFEKAEEIAIEAGAEEIIEEEQEEKLDNPDAPATWTLATDPKELYMVKSFIEKNMKGVEIVEYEMSYVPANCVQLSDEDVEKAATMCNSLQEIEDVTKVCANIQ